MKRCKLSKSRTTQLKAVILYSGGKDSNLALWYATNQGIQVKSLLSVIPETPESWMFHFPNSRWTVLQAEAMEMPVVQIETPNLKEEELSELNSAISRLKHRLEIDSLISGVVESNYQRSRLAGICERNGLKLITPLWKREPIGLIEEMLELDFDIRIVGVSALGLGEEWLGRRLDRKALGELCHLSKKYGIHPAGEGGEYETFVCDSPLFKRRIKITQTTKSWRHDSGIFLIKKAKLTEKYPLT